MSGTEKPTRLRISEVFLSIQGESRTVGWPTVFVRLTGCPLRCTYCDTQYAFDGGEWLTLEAVVQQVADFGVRHVCITGGEPLAQKGVHELMAQLCDQGFSVSLETSGALDVSRVDPRVEKVMDLKTPCSGEAARNRYENIESLGEHDQVKFVICDRDDYEWSRAVIERYALAERCEILLSPSCGAMEPRQLVEWVLEDRLPARFQLQLHKILWGAEPGR